VTIQGSEGKIKESKKIKLSFKNNLEAVKFIAKIADEKKASYIKILDMESRLIITDYFVIIGANNTRLTKRIGEEIISGLKELNTYLMNKSGIEDGNWILLDYDSFVVHIFTDEYRSYYNLERLWKDSKVIKWK
jgi:ribosome-associated protein